MTNGQIVSPTEFERLAGKAASKKWKASIRLDKARIPSHRKARPLVTSNSLIILPMSGLLYVNSRGHLWCRAWKSCSPAVSHIRALKSIRFASISLSRVVYSGEQRDSGDSTWLVAK
jgi:hypothetical protein